tara:strand:- start:841 stop:1455 length:615 start_codon:yes stop_codon:yes gene_type:complete
MPIVINGSAGTITGYTPATVADGGITSAKLASGAVGKWTHTNNTSFGTGGSYTFSGIPTDSSALRIGFMDLSSNTGSNGSESYAALRLGTASGLIDSNYDTLSSYLEDSYQQVETWTSRAILYPSNYGRAEHVFNGQIECWRLGANTNRWFIKSQVTRGAASGNQTHFFMESSIDLGANITQAQIFLNTGSFDGGSGAISYYQD